MSSSSFRQMAEDDILQDDGAKMSGALLRSGTLREFKPLGVEGQPVYSASVQLREAIRLKIGHEAANCLAIPQPNDTGDRIDWYAPMEGDVVPWSAASEDERATARQQLEALHQQLRQTAAPSLNAPTDAIQREKYLFAQLLEKSLHFPDSGHVYLVNGKPVVTFWGFAGLDGALSSPLLHLRPALASAAPTPTPAVAAVPPPLPVRRRRWWWWLLWPLLGLLLLGLLLFVLRACAPRVNLPLGLGQIDLPGLPAVSPPAPESGDIERPALPDGQVRLPDGRILSPDGTFLPEEVPAGTAEAALPAGGDVAPGVDDAASTSERAEPVNAPPVDLPVEANQGNDVPVATATDTGASATETAPELVIPPQALHNASTDFLDGRWTVETGVHDTDTGQPLRLQYEFKAGRGQVHIQRSDGLECSAPASAAIREGNLAIDNAPQAPCANGTQYDMPQIICAPEEQSAAHCHAHYRDRQFPLSMRKVS